MVVDGANDVGYGQAALCAWNISGLRANEAGTIPPCTKAGNVAAREAGALLAELAKRVHAPVGRGAVLGAVDEVEKRPLVGLDEVHDCTVARQFSDRAVFVK